MNFTTLITEVVVKGGLDTTVGFYTDSALERNIDRAYKWAAAYHKWPCTEYMDKSGLFTSGTEENSYPNTSLRTDSIRLLKIGDDLFRKLAFNDYLQFREDFSDDDEKVFSDFGRTIYINPNAATGTMYAYAQLIPAAFSAGTDTTIFSTYDEEADDAIVHQTLSLLYMRAKDFQAAKEHHAIAKEILDGLWKRTQDEQAMYQTKDREMFKRVDIVHGGFYKDLNNPLQFGGN